MFSNNRSQETRAWDQVKDWLERFSMTIERFSLEMFLGWKMTRHVTKIYLLETARFHKQVVVTMSLW